MTHNDPDPRQFGRPMPGKIVHTKHESRPDTPPTERIPTLTAHTTSH